MIYSQHSGALYAGSQYVHKSMDEGDSWEVISPDLTAAEPETMEKIPFTVVIHQTMRLIGDR